MHRRAAGSIVLLLLSGCSSNGAHGDDDDDGDGGAPGSDAGGEIDGAAAGPDGAVASGDPGSPGGFEVVVDDGVAIPRGDGSIAATVCSPSTDGVTPAAGPFPLVLLSPGFQLSRTQYAWMCEHLASWGFLTVSADYPAGGGIFDPPAHRDLAEGVNANLDWALSGASGLAARIDAQHIAAAGHSLGGKVSVLAAVLDDRIDAVVGFDPVDAQPPGGGGTDSPSVTPEMMDDLTVPLAVIGETLDGSGGFMPCAPAADNFHQYYLHACASPHALEATVAGADHMDWVGDPASCGFACSACQDGTAMDGHTRLLTRRLTVAFLDRHLRASATLQPYLTPPALGSGVTVVQRLDGCN
jgi:predicted dienelactone hydrolase